MAGLGTCEICGKERIVAGTSYTGCYCVECYKILIAECRDAINQIKKERRGEK